MNWNAEPRDVVEKAAAAGDPDAQTALRIHQSIDRIEANVEGIRTSLYQNRDALQRDLQAIRTTMKERHVRTRSWWRFW